MPESSKPSVVAVPSDRLWFDPMALVANTYMQITDYDVPMSQPFKLAPANIARFGIGFSRASAGFSIQYGPWPDVNDFVFVQDGLSVSTPYLTLFNYGPIVTSDWWCLSSSVQTIRVVENIRR